MSSLDGIDIYPIQDPNQIADTLNVREIESEFFLTLSLSFVEPEILEWIVKGFSDYGISLTEIHQTKKRFLRASEQIGTGEFIVSGEILAYGKTMVQGYPPYQVTEKIKRILSLIIKQNNSAKITLLDGIKNLPYGEQ